MKKLCTICAKKNSIDLKNKNLKKLAGKPLIYHTLKLAVKSKLFDTIIVSSDSKKILNYSRKNGASLILERPFKICKSNTPKIEAIKHAFNHAEKKLNVKFDYIFDLDVTSPLRNLTDLKKSFQLLKNSKKGNLITICESRKNPYFNMIKFKGNKIYKFASSKKKIHSRQTAPKVFEMNASIYIWKRNFLLKQKEVVNENTLSYEMPLRRSIDIDTKEDWKIVECLWKKN